MKIETQQTLSWLNLRRETKTEWKITVIDGARRMIHRGNVQKKEQRLHFKQEELEI